MAKSQKNPDSKTEKLKQLKADPKNKVTEPLSNFQTPMTGRTNGSEDELIINSVHIEKETDYLKMDSEQSGVNALRKTGELLYEAAVHKKLKNALQAFAPHMPLLCDYYPISSIRTIEKLPLEVYDSFTVTSVTLKHGKKTGIVITGWKKTQREQAQILNTPFVNFDKNEETSYPFNDNLIDLVDALKIRVNKYLNGEERGVMQAAMQFEEA